MKTWLLRISVDDSWVDDGFDFTADTIQRLKDDLLPFAYEDEVAIEVVQAPTRETILDAGN